MATFNKFNQFTQDLCEGKYNFASSGATFKVMLTNTAPVASNKIYSDISANELANGGGYTTGGATTAMSDSTASGTEKVFAGDVTWTASGSGMGPFRYAVIYCSSQATPLKPLVAWYDNGGAVTLAAGNTFTVDFDGTLGFFTVT